MRPDNPYRSITVATQDSSSSSHNEGEPQHPESDYPGERIERVEYESGEPRMGDKRLTHGDIRKNIDERRAAVLPGPTAHCQMHEKVATEEGPQPEQEYHGAGHDQPR